MDSVDGYDGQMNEGETDRDAVAHTVASALLAREGAAPAWGFELEDVRSGYSRVAMIVRPDMLNGFGTAHGGIIFALADSAFAYACNSRNEVTVGQQASIAFLSPAHVGERLVAVAEEVAVTGRSGVYVVLVNAGDGRAIAHFQGLSRTIGGPVLKETPGD